MDVISFKVVFGKPHMVVCNIICRQELHLSPYLKPAERTICQVSLALPDCPSERVSIQMHWAKWA